MENALVNIELENYVPQKDRVNEVLDYSEILRLNGAEFYPAAYYWQVGEINRTQGWILHLSVVKSALSELLHLIIPQLLSQQVPFKIVRDSDIAAHVIAGNLGSALLAKMVSIYPNDNKQACILAKQLIALTHSFKGPQIPTDYHLGAIVYTRYGSFNPIIGSNGTGESIKFIYDSNGQLVPDPYTIPFEIPSGVSWPFLEIANPDSNKPGKLLNGKYFPIKVIKPDAKGRVIKALYFKTFWQIKSCLIKEGRLNMFTDEFGRNIQDRLKWQYDLYNDLKKDIPMPEVLDYFYEHGDNYIAMQFIEGLSLAAWISIAYHNRIWANLSLPSRLQLLDPLLEILTIIQRLHKRGYIHRDLTPENFLIDSKERIYLIDMELAWSQYTGKPDPPFKLGTPGFMSPEQENWLPPTVKEDIYGIGGLMVVFFTNLMPMKFSTRSTQCLTENLYFFIREWKISHLIANCFQNDPYKRPELQTIITTLQEYRQELSAQTEEIGTLQDEVKSSVEDIKAVINAGINGLTVPELISEHHHWLSKIQRKETNIGNEQMELDLYPGLQTGMSGPLYFVAKAKRQGFNIENCMTSYTKSWEFIQNQYFTNQAAFPTGLYKGGAGIAIALTEGLKSGIILPDSETIELLKQCFLHTPLHFDLATGWAGQGLALLHCTPWIKRELLEDLLKPCIENLVTSQLADGSWQVANSAIKGDISFGLDHGVAGITWFLLAYLEYNKDYQVEKAIRNSLQWLVQKAIKKRGGYIWTISTKKKRIEEWSCSDGNPGILLVLIKGYSILQDPLYREIVEKGLLRIQRYPIRPDTSLATGLVGLGEVYLEAFKTFNNQEWKIRADWIATFFCRTFHDVEKGKGYWYVNNSTIITADLFTGYTGVLIFLIQYLNIEQGSHPLLPDNRQNEQTLSFQNNCAQSGESENL